MALVDDYYAGPPDAAILRAEHRYDDNAAQAGADRPACSDSYSGPGTFDEPEDNCRFRLSCDNRI